MREGNEDPTDSFKLRLKLMKARRWEENEVVLIPLPSGESVPKHDCQLLDAHGVNIPSIAIKSDLKQRCGRCLSVLDL